MYTSSVLQILFLILVARNIQSTQTIRFMQYNVEWMFLDYYKSADCPGNGCPWKNETHSQEHIDEVSNVISQYNPDIINLCEVEGVTEMTSLIEAIQVNQEAQPKKYTPYFIQGTDTSTGQNVGLISTIEPTTELARNENTTSYPITNSYCNATTTGSTGVSKHYITTISIPTTTETTTETTARRTSVSKPDTSTYLRLYDDDTKYKFLYYDDNDDDYDDDTTIVITDTIIIETPLLPSETPLPPSETPPPSEKISLISFHLIAYPMDPNRCAKREAQAKIIEQSIITEIEKGNEVIVMGDFNDYDNEINDANNDKPISQVLDIIKSNQNDKYKLYNIAKQIPQEERFTNWWDKNENCESTKDEFVLIDHVLVTSKLLPKISNVKIDHGYDEYCNKLDSDHYPIIFDLTI